MSNDLINSMTTDVNVGINEVVSIFVAKYEDGLFAKKDELTSQLRTLKQDLSNIDKDLISQVDKSKYVGELNMPALKISAAVDDVEVAWTTSWNRDVTGVYIGINIFCGEDKIGSRDIRVMSIPKGEFTRRKEINAAIEAKNAELVEVMSQIKMVGRKERQIRGRISEMKLEQAGKSDLLQNSSLLQLVHVQ